MLNRLKRLQLELQVEFLGKTHAPKTPRTDTAEVLHTLNDYLDQLPSHYFDGLLLSLIAYLSIMKIPNLDTMGLPSIIGKLAPEQQSLADQLKEILAASKA